jgi:hypothetical protein
MKHCPACNFTFPDFHLVCDFDGTELIPDPERLSLIKIPARRSHLRAVIMSPKALTAVAIVGLFLSAAFIAYRQTTSRSTRTLLATNVAIPPLQTAEATSKPELRARSVSVAPSHTREKPPVRAQRSLPGRSSFARHRPETPDEHLSRQPEVARRADESPSESQPKLVSMLKTTWRVLKRPFSF